MQPAQNQGNQQTTDRQEQRRSIPSKRNTQLIDAASQGKSVKPKKEFVHSFGFWWSLLNAAATIYSIFSALFWFSSMNFPSGYLRTIDLMVELLFIVDYLVRILFWWLKQSNNQSQNNASDAKVVPEPKPIVQQQLQIEELNERRRLAPLEERSFYFITTLSTKKKIYSLCVTISAIPALVQLALYKQLTTNKRRSLSLFYTQVLEHIALFSLLVWVRARHLYPKICMEHDMVLRAGEIAEEFYIIKKGQVEVIATDGKTVICLLDEGSYFGEIALLGMNQGKRTASIRARTNCLFMCLTKEKFLQVLDLFPDYKQFLRRIGRQRWGTTNSDDVPTGLLPYVPYDEIEDRLLNKKRVDALFYFSQYLPEAKELRRQNEELSRQRKRERKQLKRQAAMYSDDEEDYYEEENEQEVNQLFNEDLSTLVDRLEIWNEMLLIPNYHILHIAWICVMIVVFSYNLFYIPLSLAFEIDFPVSIDALAIFLYVADCFVKAHTLTYDEKDRPLTVPSSIAYRYFNKHFFLDLFATLPLDYIFNAFDVAPEVHRGLRFLRLLKLYRLLDFSEETSKDQEKQSKYDLLLSLALFFVLLNHLAACIMFTIVRSEYYSPNRPAVFMETILDDNVIQELVPVMERSVYDRYINFAYWSLMMATSGSYGDICAITPREKAFQLFATLFFRIYMVLIVSEISHVTSTYKSHLSRQLEKLDIIKQWMSHNMLPAELSKRVNKYMGYVWQKFKGLEDAAILRDLPETVQNEIILALMSRIVEKIFLDTEATQPQNTGAILSLLRKLKQVLVARGEYVFRKGEIATEMYFIIEGRAHVQIELPDGTSKEIAKLKKTEFFGEGGLIEGKMTRGADVVADTNLFLACLTIEDFETIVRYYPEVKHQLHKVMLERQQEMRRQMEMRNAPSQHSLASVSSGNQSMTGERGARRKGGPRTMVAAGGGLNAMMRGGAVAARNGPNINNTNGQKSFVQTPSGKTLDPQQGALAANSIKLPPPMLGRGSSKSSPSNVSAAIGRSSNASISRGSKKFKDESDVESEKVDSVPLALTRGSIERFTAPKRHQQTYEFDQRLKVNDNYEDDEYEYEQDKDMSQHENGKHRVSIQEEEEGEDRQQSDTQQQKSTKRKRTRLTSVTARPSSQETAASKRSGPVQQRQDYFFTAQKKRSQGEEGDDEGQKNNTPSVNSPVHRVSFKVPELLNNPQQQVIELNTANLMFSSTAQESQLTSTELQHNNQQLPPAQLPNGAPTRFDSEDAAAQQKELTSRQNSPEDLLLNTDTNQPLLQANSQDSSARTKKAREFFRFMPLKKHRPTIAGASFNNPAKLLKDVELDDSIIDDVTLREGPSKGLHQQHRRSHSSSLSQLSVFQSVAPASLDFSLNDKDLSQEVPRQILQLDQLGAEKYFQQQNADISRLDHESEHESTLSLVDLLNSETAVNFYDNQEEQENQEKSENFAASQSAKKDAAEERSMRQNENGSVRENSLHTLVDSALDKNISESAFENSGENERLGMDLKNNLSPNRKHPSEPAPAGNASFSKENLRSTQQVNRKSSHVVHIRQFSSGSVGGNHNELEMQINEGNDAAGGAAAPANDEEQQEGALAQQLWERFKFHAFSLQQHSALLFCIFLFNYIYIPFQLAFKSYSYFASGTLLGIEIFGTLVLFFYAIAQFLEPIRQLEKQRLQRLEEENYAEDKVKEREKMKRAYLELFYNLVVALPLPLIFEAAQVESRRQNYGLILLQCLRLTNFRPIFSFIYLLGRKNLAIEIIIALTFAFLWMQHFCGCFFIVLANMESNFKNCWYVKIPAPLNYIRDGERTTFDVPDMVIYLHGLYWAFVTTSHVGVGDVTAVNIRERTYACLVMLISAFTNAYFFGNFASMVGDYSTQIKKIFNHKYNQAMEVVKNFDLDILVGKIDQYFQYIWRTQLGLDENEILSQLPNSLKVDILHFMYQPAIDKSCFFSDQNRVDASLLSSILRFIQIQIYLPQDLIVVAGEIYPSVFLLLKGSASVHTFEGEEIRGRRIRPGDFFGSIEEGSEQQRQPAYVRAEKMVKVGVLRYTEFRMICHAFPNWYAQIQEKNYSFRKDVLCKAIRAMAQAQAKQVVNGQQQPSEYSRILDRLLQEDQPESVISEEELNLEVTDRMMSHFRQNMRQFVHSEDDEKYQQKEAHELQRGNTQQQPTNAARRMVTGAVIINNNQQIIVRAITEISDLVDMCTLIWRKPRYHLFINVNGTVRLYVDVLHLIFVLYFIYVLPFFIAFSVKLNTFLITMESLYLMQQLLYIFCKARIPFYRDGAIQNSVRNSFRLYRQSEGFWLDIVSLLPFNLIFQSLDTLKMPNEAVYYLIMLLRLTRMLQLQEVPDLLIKMEIRHRRLQSLFMIFKSVLILVLVWHLYACVWFWLNSHYEENIQVSWIKENHFDVLPLYQKYLYSMYFFISVASTCGFTEMEVYSNLERIYYMFTIYGGNALFAVCFGLMASQSQILPEKLTNFLPTMRKINALLQQKSIPVKLKNRLEQYFDYIMQSQIPDQSELRNLQSILPQTIYNEMLYLNVREFLKEFKTINDMGNPLMLRQIATVLQPMIFLENDYVVYKGDLGEEMYFIAQGQVSVLSLNEESEIVKLKQGKQFGEGALFADDSKRMCSITAASMCQLYVLKKHNLERIFRTFPDLRQKFREEGERVKRDFEKKEQVQNLQMRKAQINQPHKDPDAAKITKSKQQSVKKEEAEDAQNQKKQKNLMPKLEVVEVDPLNDTFSSHSSENLGSEEEEQMRQRALKQGGTPQLLATKRRQTQAFAFKELTTSAQENDEDSAGNTELSKPQSIHKAAKKKLSFVVAMKKEGKKRLTAKLEAIPIPTSALPQEQRPRDSNIVILVNGQQINQKLDRLYESNNFNIRKISYLCHTFEEDENYDFHAEDQDASLQELVQDDEFEKLEPHKQSRRKKFRNDKERRLSRLTLGKQLQLSKNSGVRLNWGLSLRYHKFAAAGSDPEDEKKV